MITLMEDVSTHKVYDSKWDIFKLWCLQWDLDLDLVNLPITNVVDFFVHLLMKTRLQRQLRVTDRLLTLSGFLL